MTSYSASLTIAVLAFLCTAAEGVAAASDAQPKNSKDKTNSPDAPDNADATTEVLLSDDGKAAALDLLSLLLNGGEPSADDIAHAVTVTKWYATRGHHEFGNIARLADSHIAEFASNLVSPSGYTPNDGESYFDFKARSGIYISGPTGEMDFGNVWSAAIAQWVPAS